MRAGWYAVMLVLLAVSAAGAQQPELYSTQELNDLVAPIALYPDPLLAQMLPAATFSDQVQAAAALVQTQGEAAVESQDWDASVKTLARYPEALQMMADNPEWTQALGYAVVYQNQQVLEAVQEMRRRAQAAGNLASTPEQTVTTEDQIVTITPAQSNVIYVPYYDPQVVYVNQGPTWGEAVTVGLITFGTAYALGSLGYRYFDWHHYGWYRPPYYRPIPPYRPPPPPIYRPPYRPGTRPPGARPPGRPPTRPEARPPVARPPTRPEARPPAARPPTRPEARPPVARPPTRPGARPPMPSTRPAVPSTRPSAPSARPAPRPDRGRPSAAPRPSGAGFGGYTSRPQVQQQRSRGQQSMGRARPSAAPRARAGAPRPSAPRGGGGRRR